MIPGESYTIDPPWYCRLSRFTIIDLPTFGRPTIATSGSWLVSQISSRAPVGWDESSSSDLPASGSSSKSSITYSPKSKSSSSSSARSCAEKPSAGSDAASSKLPGGDTLATSHSCAAERGTGPRALAHSVLGGMRAVMCPTARSKKPPIETMAVREAAGVPLPS